MDTQFLETFLVVVERGSMAGAARRLGISPAAVAQRIAALESEIGAPLLMRSGRAVQPSDAGHAIIAQSRRILGDLRQLRLLALADQPGGELRLGAISTALTGLLPPALRRLTDTAPDLDIFVLPGTSPELYRQLAEGDLDAALLVRPPFAVPKSLTLDVLRREPMVLLCPEAWADQDPAALLRDRPFIRYDRNNWGGRVLDNWLKAQRLVVREWLELDQLEAIAVMVSNQLGVSIVPDWSRPWPEGLRVQRLPLPAPEIPSRDVVLMWDRASPAARLIRKLRTELQTGP